MTEEEKLDAGLYYDFWDAGVNGRKRNAIRFCRELRQLQDADASEAEQATLIGEYFGSVGRDATLCPALCATAAGTSVWAISSSQTTM